MTFNKIAYWRDQPPGVLKSLTPTAHAVWKIIYDKSKGDGTGAIVSVPRLMEQTGRSESAVEVALRRLRDMRCVKLVKPGGRRGDGSTYGSIYDLLMPASQPVDSESQPVDSEEPQPVDDDSQPVENEGSQPVDFKSQPVDFKSQPVDFEGSQPVENNPLTNPVTNPVVTDPVVTDPPGNREDAYVGSNDEPPSQPLPKCGTCAKPIFNPAYADTGICHHCARDREREQGRQEWEQEREQERA